MAFRVHTDRLRKGMVIKNDVYSKTGAVLIPVNTPVTKEVLALLTRHFIDYVMVDYQSTESSPADIPSPESVPKIQQKQEEEFKESFHIAETVLSENLIDIVTKDKDLDVPVLLNMLNNIVDKSGNEVNFCNMLIKMKKSAEGLYTHSINVALWGQVLAKWMNFEDKDVELVGAAGLLHDIGLLKLTNSAYHKYDSNMLMTFISHLTNNFIRHNVRLSNDVVGQIVLINKFNLTRPLVQIGNSFIDLAVRKDLVIKELLD